MKLRCPYLLLLLACVLLPDGRAFSEYNYLLEPVPFPSLSAYLSPADCHPPAVSLLEGFPDFQAARFQESLSYYRSAASHLRKANQYAPWAPYFRYAHPLTASLGSWLCLKESYGALEDGLRSARSALSVLDSDLAQFEALADHSEDFTGGVRAELDEFKSQMQQGNRPGMGLAPRLLAVHDALSKLSQSSSAPADFSVLGLLLSSDSLVTEAMGLSSRLNDAVSQLQVQDRQLEDQYAQGLLDFQRHEKEIQDEKLLSVDLETVAPLVGDSLDPIDFASLSSTWNGAQSLVKSAQQDATAASREHSSKSKGYLGRAVSFHRRSVASLAQASFQLASLEAKAASVKRRLEQSNSQRYAAWQETVAAKKTQPSTYAFLLEIGDSFARLRESYFKLSLEGEKIGALVVQSRKLDQMEQAAQSTDAFVWSSTQLSARLDHLAVQLKQARLDGLSVEMESHQLDQLQQAASALPFPGPDDAAALSSLNAQAESLENSLFENARESFALLPVAFARCDSVASYLPDSLQSRVISARRFFPGGVLAIPLAFGSLSFLNSLTEECRTWLEVHSDALILQSLRDSMQLDWVVPPAPLGATVALTVQARFENDLPFSSQSAIRVSLPLPVSDIQLSQAPPGTSLSSFAGKPVVVFDTVDPGFTFVSLSFHAAISKLVSQQTTTVSVDENSAVHLWRMTYSTERNAPVVLPFPAMDFSSYRVLDSAPFRVFQEGGQSGLIVESAPGEHSVSVEFTAPSPLQLVQTESSSSGASQSATVLLDYQNKGPELPAVSWSFHSNAICPAADVRVEPLSPDVKAHLVSQNPVILELSVPRWESGVHKLVKLSGSCLAFSSASSSLRAQLDGWMPLLSADPTLEAIWDKANRQFLAGDVAGTSQSLDLLAQTYLRQNMTEEIPPTPLPFPLPSPAVVSDSTESVPDLSSAISQGRESLASFQTAFFAPPGLETAVRRLPQYSAANAAATDLNKTLSALDALGDVKKSQSWWNARQTVLTQAPTIIAEQIRLATDQAASTYSDALQRQSQFGTAASQALLDSVSIQLEDGHVAAATVLLTQLSSEYAPSSVPSSAQSLSVSWLLVLPALGLAYAAYRMLWKKPSGVEEDA